MSRSIHTTRRTLAELRKSKFATPEDRAEALKKARAQLRRKRRIKESMQATRDLVAPLEGTAIETIPILHLEEAPFVYHPLSLTDTRNLLSRLPQAAAEAITAIHFKLGKQYMAEWNSFENNYEPDPHTGRFGDALIPGVFCGPVFGTYFPADGRIDIYAFVFDPTVVPMPPAICEFYLRVHAAKTLIHEIAHHHDHTQRVARGRWLADRKANVEHYAEKMEHEWGRTVLVPFFEQAYAAQTKEFLDWVGYHGGIHLPLDFFLGDPRATLRNGGERFFWSMTSGFEDWIWSLPECKNLLESRFAFSRELHFADQYTHCLSVLEGILAESPDYIPAVESKADTLVHLERYDEALEIAIWLLERDAANWEAWNTRADVFEAREDWHRLLEICDQWGKIEPGENDAKRILIFRAVAFCGLGQSAEVERIVDEYVSLKNPRDPARSKRFWLRAVHRRAGKPLLASK